MIGTAGDYTLDDDAVWGGPDPLVVDFLNLRYDPRDDRFPYYLPFGVMAVEEAAKWLKADPRLDPRMTTPLPKGVLP